MLLGWPGEDGLGEILRERIRMEVLDVGKILNFI